MGECHCFKEMGMDNMPGQIRKINPDRDNDSNQFGKIDLIHPKQFGDIQSWTQ